MKQVTYKWFSQNLQGIFNRAECPTVYYVLSDTLEVHYGNEDDCDLKYCKKHNIPVYNLYRCGGTIVCCDGTIGVALFHNINDGWIGEKIEKDFIDFLKSKGVESTLIIEDNDVLLNGYKVASVAECIPECNTTRMYSAFLVSYDVDLDAIQHICKKPMKKVPIGLKEVGIKKDDLINWIIDYFTAIENKNDV